MEVLAWVFLIITFAFIAIVLFNIVRYSIEIMYFRRELKNAERVRLLPNALSVEGEVLEIHEKRWSQWDVQYTVKLGYSIGERFFYKDFTFLNKASLRVGAKIKLLCDGAEPENAVVSDGSQASSLNGLISKMIGNIILVIIGMAAAYLNFLLGVGEIVSRMRG